MTLNCAYEVITNNYKYIYFQMYNRVTGSHDIEAFENKSRLFNTKTAECS